MSPLENEPPQPEANWKPCIGSYQSVTPNEAKDKMWKGTFKYSPINFQVKTSPGYTAAYDITIIFQKQDNARRKGEDPTALMYQVRGVKNGTVFTPSISRGGFWCVKTFVQKPAEAKFSFPVPIVDGLPISPDTPPSY